MPTITHLTEASNVEPLLAIVISSKLADKANAFMETNREVAVGFLSLNEAIASRAVILISSGLDGGAGRNAFRAS